MNRKENFMRFVKHEPHDHIPCRTDTYNAGGPAETFENGDETGYDGFGLKWVRTESTGGMGTPEAGQVLIPDVTQWRNYLKLPNVSAINWENDAATQLARFNAEQQVLIYGCWNGPFLRFTHLLGFEDGLCALLEEPEASRELIEALNDYRISTLPYIKKYFNPDIVTLYDDVAQSTGMFIAPDVYEEMFFPAHKRFFDAVRELDMIPSIHICGRCEDIIPLIVQAGAEMWEIAEPTNDLIALSQQWGDRLAILGGISMTGPLALKHPTAQELRDAAREAMEKYAPLGNYGLNGMMLYSNANDTIASITKMNAEAVDYGTNYYVDGPGAGVFA